MYSPLKTYSILFAGVFALSTSAIFVKLSEASSSVTAFYRLMIAALVLTPVFLLSKASRKEASSLSKSQWLSIIGAGLFLALHYLMWFESLNFTSVASSTVLVCLQPLFSLAYDRFLSHKKVSSTALIGCAIALAGSAVIGAGDFQISGRALFGDVLALAAAGVISFYFYVGEKVRKEVSAITYSTFSYYSSALILLVYILARGEALTGYGSGTWMAFTGLALVSTICGQFVFNLLLKHIPASAVTMGILGEPVGTCILAFFILKEKIAGQQLLGIAVIMAGMAVFFAKPKEHK